MTSRSLSFSERLKNHKKYISRTLWTSIIGIVLMAIYYMIGTIMMISRSINYAQIYHQSAFTLQHAKYNAVGRVMGFEQLGFVITIFIAIAFAFQGFSYVFDQKKLDFYLSQPTTRAQRLWKNYFNAFSTYILMYVAVMAVSIIIAAAMGGVNSVVLATILLEMVRNLLFFFAIYNIAVLAILLSGTLPIAVLVLIYMLAISAFTGFMLYLYKGVFFATFSYSENSGIIASPIMDRLNQIDYLKNLADGNNYYTSFEGFYRSLSAVMPGTIDTLVTGIVALVFVVIFSRYRRAEHAGHTIVYKPFRWFVKISACVLVGLASGYIVYSLYNYVWNDRMFIFVFVVILLSTVICGCVLEAILESNIKKLFEGKAQTLMALAIVALTFVIFKGDLLGYDSYIPAASKVESCALSDGDYSCMVNYNYIDMDGDHMYIRDVESFIKLAEIGMKAQKEYIKQSRNNRYIDAGWSDIDIFYRLKNGKNVYRRITIPYDVDRELISSIIDSKEYKEGYYAVFYDDVIRENDINAVNRSVQYDCGLTRLDTDRLPYSELSDAYRKDILENYSFEMANNNLPVGQVQYSAYLPDNDGINSDYTSYDMRVYANFENTIALLKKYGIYSESVLDVEYIENVCVTNNYPGYDISKMASDEIYNLEVESVSEYYADPEQIREIIDSSLSSEFYGMWFRYKDHFNDQYSIEINLSKPLGQYGSTTSYRNFLLGKVPEFVIKDTN